MALLSSAASTALLALAPLSSNAPALLRAALVLLLACAAHVVARFCYHVLTDHFALGRYGPLPRPARRRFFSWPAVVLGDSVRIAALPPVEAHRQFVQETGSHVLVYRMLGWKPRLLLADPAAVLHILSARHAYSFPKPHWIRSFLARGLGNGLLVVEGTSRSTIPPASSILRPPTAERRSHFARPLCSALIYLTTGTTHKNQRRTLQPAFSLSVIRALVPTFFWHARRLTTRLGSAVDACHGPSDAPLLPGQTPDSSRLSAPGAPVVDLYAWVSRCTLDTLADAGFDWMLDSILMGDPQHPCGAVDAGAGQADAAAATTPRKVDAMSDALQAIFTPVRMRNWEAAVFLLRSAPLVGPMAAHIVLPFERRQDRGLQVIQDSAREILETKRQQILAEMAGTPTAGRSAADWEQGTGATGGKDLLFHMLRSNLSHDLPATERLTDEELMGQMTTLLAAGYETTGTLLTWALYELARCPRAQHKLRQELQQFVAESGRDVLSYQELMSLPYLDAVIKETLRVRTPLPSTFRTAAHDAVIPLSRPYLARDGRNTFNHVVVHQGEELFLPLGLINTSDALWAPDPTAWRPERWFDVPPTAKTGLPLYLTSFLSGPRGCIGNRFALAEAKAVLFSCLLAFEFHTVDGWEIEPKQAMVLRFFVKGQGHHGLQMPLRIRRLPASPAAAD